MTMICVLYLFFFCMCVSIMCVYEVETHRLRKVLLTPELNCVCLERSLLRHSTQEMLSASNRGG